MSRTETLDPTKEKKRKVVSNNPHLHGQAATSPNTIPPLNKVYSLCFPITFTGFRTMVFSQLEIVVSSRVTLFIVTAFPIALVFGRLSLGLDKVFTAVPLALIE
jgi:hypothetical protein